MADKRVKRSFAFTKKIYTFGSGLRYEREPEAAKIASLVREGAVPLKD
jgi:hypothetical protein